MWWIIKYETNWNLVHLKTISKSVVVLLTILQACLVWVFWKYFLISGLPGELSFYPTLSFGLVKSCEVLHCALYLPNCSILITSFARIFWLFTFCPSLPVKFVRNGKKHMKQCCTTSSVVRAEVKLCLWVERTF